MIKKITIITFLIVLIYTIPIYGEKEEYILPPTYDTTEEILKNYLENAKVRTDEHKTELISMKQQNAKNNSICEEKVIIEESNDIDSSEDVVAFEDSSNYYNNAAEVDEIEYLYQMVCLEIGNDGDGEDYYMACYLQAAVALNRIKTGWGSNLTEVLFQEGQFYGYGYYTWDWSSIAYDNPVLIQAVNDCINNNTTPSNLIYADSRHNHEGTDSMSFYTEIYGQDFYLSY